MAHNSELPCDGDGVCMVCKKKPAEEDTLTCKTCNTPWHVPCLSSPPETLVSTLQWDCPDCSTDHSSAPQPVPVAAKSAESGDLLASIRAIEADASLTEEQKAKKRQDLMSRGADHEEEEKVGGGGGEVFDLFDGSLNCSFCMQLPERPVTTPCGHNFCLKCFQKWIGLGHKTCAKCRHAIPPKMASQPRINASLVVAMRMARLARMSKSGTTTREPLKVYNFLHNQNLPDTAFVTERAKKAGKANACSGKIFVTVPADHFGPILADNDPVRNQGVLVGECWEDRLECRQWGTHLPHVAGIAGQSKYGAQSVALSGGYEDDEDHGEWFLYTGSGGRDLSGNKRTNKEQSFDQKFEKSNEALRVSCKNGYPVRVVRSHKEKRSSYAPEGGVRYDGIYRIEKCWRKVGIQGFKVCRYLFVRCDNEPAPWTSDEHGDKPRALPAIKELKKATDITNRKEDPSWDYDEVECCWKWKKPPPMTRAMSRKPIEDGDLEEMKSVRIAAKQEQTLSVRVKKLSVREKVLKEFSCLICRKVMTLPVTTPCAHNFCKHCLEGAFEGQTFLKERKCDGRRTLRTQKNIMKCPSCTMDISDFLQDLQINRELMGVIESLRSKTEENVEEAEDNVEDSSKEESDGTDENVEEAEDNVEKLSKDESDGTEKKSEACVEKMDISTESFEALKVCNKAIQSKLEEKKAGGEEKEKPSRKKKAGGEEKEKPSRKKKAGTDDNVEEGEDNVEKLSKDENDGTEKKAEACVEKMKIITEGFEVLKVRNKAIQNKLEEKKAGGEGKEKPSRKKKASGEQKEKPSRKKADAVIGDKKDDEMPDSAKEVLHTPTTRSRQKRKLADSDCGGSTGGVRTRSMKAKELVDEGKQPHKRKKADHPASVSKSGKVKTRSNKS